MLHPLVYFVDLDEKIKKCIMIKSLDHFFDKLRLLKLFIFDLLIEIDFVLRSTKLIVMAPNDVSFIFFFLNI